MLFVLLDESNSIALVSKLVNSALINLSKFTRPESSPTSELQIMVDFFFFS